MYLCNMARSEVVELRLAVELLEIKLEYLKAGKTAGAAEAIAWGRAFSVRWRRRYQVSRVCRIWDISRATLYRHMKEAPARWSRSQWSDEEVVRRLRLLIDESPFPAERYRKLWHRLRLQGVLVSKERVRLLINKHQLLPAYGIILADRPNQLWGIDAARVKTTDRSLCFVIFAVEHCTGECLAIDVVEEETAALWVRLICNAVQFAYGELRPDIARGLRIRCDNLPLFRERQFCRPLAKFGIKVTYIWPLTPRGNGLAERFVRTLRDNRLAVRFFATSSELLVEMTAFRTTYNASYILQRWKYRTPAEVRALFFAREM
jgi:putative transposase